ncbi:transposase [Streptomyces massasporeus]
MCFGPNLRSAVRACPRQQQRSRTLADHAIDRSRGWTDHKDPPRCRPLAFVLTARQAGDSPVFTDVTARRRVPRRRGRPLTRPDVVLADKTYSSRAIRDHLRERGIRAVIPVRAHQQHEEAEAADHRPFDRDAYKQRDTLERCINRLKQWRSIATRYETTATVYLAGLHIAGNFLWVAR